MLACATCDSRWDEEVPPAVSFASDECPLCGGGLVPAAPKADAREPVHGDVATTLREHLLGVGA